MECEVPEVVVFLKENGCQFFKDICMGGEVPCHEKCCVKNCELDHNNISNLLKYELARNSTEVSEEVVLYISTMAEESFSNHDSNHDDVKLCGVESKLMENKAVPSETDDFSSKKEFSERRNFATSEQITCLSLSQLFSSEDLGDDQQNDQKDPKMEIVLADSWSGIGADLRSEIDLGAERIADNASSQRFTAEHHKTKKIAGVEPTPETEKKCQMADKMSKVPLLASSSSSRQNTVGHHREPGSSSFSAASTPSGRLTFSGLMPYSDTISLRSNSTTSTRSFAFPILATEWNESPIRMAEVERRSKKCRCWRMCFTCSKF
ncbi:hypothetical protein ACH5RR_008711 [Cinchona calisaya]|uniref:CRC domain-containing protein n=1 Tax=Cinchona calisaya TaxID=153742 RepID=A0ABD3ACI1_9GENT